MPPNSLISQLPSHSQAMGCANAARRNRGVSLLQVLVLVAVLSSLAVMAYLTWHQRSLVQGARQEQHVLAQADRSLTTFATIMHRLPCPDTDRDGLENCESPLQKGWLPVRSIKQAGADAGVGIGQLRYLVQRGGQDDDLTELSDTWRPLAYHEAEGTYASMRTASDYQEGIHTLPDLCQRLSTGAAAAYAPGRAAVRSEAPRPVAYALMHPGVQGNTANNSLFDGANQTAANEVEDSTYAPVLAQYDDVVLVRSYASLREQFVCQILIDSINLIALAEDLSADVEDKRQNSIADARNAIIFASIGAAITTVETIKVGLEIGSELSNAAVATTFCAITLGLAVNACAAAPLHYTAAALGGGVVAANIASIAANVTAAVKAGQALALADNAVNASDLSCPNVGDPEAAIVMLAEQLANAQQEVLDLDNKIQVKRGELVAAESSKTQALERLWAAVREASLTSTIDNKVTALIDAANGQQSAQQTFNRVNAELQVLQDTITNYTTNLAQYQQMLASYTGAANATALQQTIATLKLAMDALQEQVDSLQNASNVDEEQLEALRQQLYQTTARHNILERYRDSGDVTELQEEVARASDALAQAQGQLTAAQDAYNTGQSSLNAAKTSYASAYASLLNHGRYFYGSPGLQACTNQDAAVCTDTLNTTAQIHAAIAQLMGTNDDRGPQPGSVFVRPHEIQQEIEQLELQRAPARDRVISAQSNLTQAQQAATNMPVCTITGSGVGPMPVEIVQGLLINADRKGGIR